MITRWQDQECAKSELHLTFIAIEAEDDEIIGEIYDMFGTRK